jgi:hypothetical protein
MSNGLWKGNFLLNFSFTFSLATILSELGRFDEAFAIARDLEKKIQNGSLALQLMTRHDPLVGEDTVQPGGICQGGGIFSEGLEGW